MSLYERDTNMDELLIMSKKELSRLEVMSRLKDKRLTQGKAAQIIGVSIRQIKRLWQRYQRQGAEGIRSKKRNRPSNNRLDAGLVQEVLDLIEEKYEDFGPTLAHEKLTEIHHLRISRESVRKIMIENDIWHTKKVKPKTVHQLRERKACLGELVQIDGSDHDWFEGRAPKCTLLVYIDDATSRLMEMRFVPSETTFAYFAATCSYLERHGKPIAFYSDQHGIFRVNQERPLGESSGLTQFGRALRELDIQIICASTPQAKGRVERANQTLQDRLIKELRLRGISDMDTANAFLPAYCQDYNNRFAVVPRSNVDVHRPLSPHQNLDLIFTRQATRTISRNLTVHFENVVYQIQTSRPDYALRNAKVLVCINQQNLVSILYKGQVLPYTIFHKAPKQSEIVDSKNIDSYFKSPHIPASNHPWKTYGFHLNGKPIQESIAHVNE